MNSKNQIHQEKKRGGKLCIQQKTVKGNKRFFSCVDEENRKKENGKYIKTHKIINENTRDLLHTGYGNTTRLAILRRISYTMGPYIMLCCIIVKLPFHNGITHTDEWVMSNVGKSLGWH